MPWRLAPPAALAAVLLVLPAQVFAQAAPDPRADLQAVQSALEGAVARVSRSGTSLILGGSDYCRGYHLKGLGAIFILAPRALPEGPVFIVRGRTQTDVARLRQERRRLQREAKSLVQSGRADEAELREQGLKTMEEQAEALQHQTERDRQKAERDLEEIRQEFQIRLGPLPPPSSPTPGPLPQPIPPPWRFWFESDGPEDTRAPGEVISDVRAAVTSTLEGRGPGLRILRPEESVVVAVDFVLGSPFLMVRPQRTLVVRVRKKELDDRAAGRIAPEELHRRIEYVEY